MSTLKTKMFESLGNAWTTDSEPVCQPAEQDADDPGGHAVHFLERLERASGSQEELALRLYNNPELLRYVLRKINVPDEFERVAVSLHEADLGPYVVVTREGRFVTCLGRGMSIHGLYLFNHSRLLDYIEKDEEYQRRADLAQSLVGERHQLKKLYTRVMKTGLHVSREEILALSVVQPAIKAFFLRKLIQFTISVDDLSRVLLRRNRFTKKDNEGLKTYYDHYWAAGHTALLAAMSGPSGIEGIIEFCDNRFLRMFTLLLHAGAPGMLYRLAWFIGKMGKILLPEVKSMVLAPRVREEWILGLLGLFVLGTRHRKLRGEVIKTINSIGDSFNNFGRDALALIINEDANIDEVLQIGGSAMVSPDKWYEQGLGSSRRLFRAANTDLIKKLGPDATKEEDCFPEEWVMPFMASDTISFLKHPRAMNLHFALVSWLARCEAEDFFAPQSFHKIFIKPSHAEKGIELIEQERERWGKNEPIEVAQEPSRNEPCPCGSGKKYKRCCNLTN